MLFRFCLLTVVFVSCWSCNNSKTPNKIPFAYFDNARFFEQEMIRLRGAKTRETKTVVSNGKSETIEISTIDWKKELRVFQQITLNKSSFSGKYHIDSLKNGALTTTRYSRIDEKLPIVYLAYGDSLGKIVWVEAKSQEISQLINNEMSWRYVPDSGYAVHGFQKILGGSESAFKISVNFEN
jgi:hypothetical protein